jgi:hypothetical protein
MYRMLIFLLLLLTAHAPCHGRIVQQVSEVQVLVLDYKTGRPVPGWSVEMKLPDAKGEIHRFPLGTFKETGENGIVVFQIKAPLPPQVGVSIKSPCTRREVFDTSEMLQQGTIGDHADFESCKSPTSRTVVAQPGQIVIYIHLPTVWQKIRHFFWSFFDGYC